MYDFQKGFMFFEWLLESFVKLSMIFPSVRSTFECAWSCTDGSLEAPVPKRQRTAPSAAPVESVTGLDESSGDDGTISLPVFSRVCKNHTEKQTVIIILK